MNQIEISFYNTIKLDDNELIEADDKTSKQEERILKFFQQSKYNSYTPAEIYIAFGQQWPITSVRRAITNLTNKGDLIKLKEQRKGIFGLSNHTWKLNLKND